MHYSKKILVTLIAIVVIMQQGFSMENSLDAKKSASFKTDQKYIKNFFEEILRMGLRSSVIILICLRLIHEDVGSHHQ